MVDRGGIQSRFRQWIEREGLTRGEVLRAVNERLPEDRQIKSESTITHYQTRSKAPPQADFVAALKLAYPQLNVSWLLSGLGKPSVTESELAAQTDEERGQSYLRKRLRREYPVLWRFSSAEREAFLETLSRYVLTAPDGAGLGAVDERGKSLDEDGVEALVEVAGDLLWLLHLPVRSDVWGLANAGRERPGQLQDYRLAMMGALRTLMLERGKGSPMEGAAHSRLRHLRRRDEDERAKLDAVLPDEPLVERRVGADGED